MPAKKSVNSCTAAGSCIVHSAARCNSRPAKGSIRVRSAPSAASSAETRLRNAARGPAPSAISGFSAAPAAASAALRASPANSPASSAAAMSKIISPIAMPPRGGPPAGLNTPSGRFWIGNSLWPLAEATQLCRRMSWVSSMAAMIPPLSQGAKCVDHRNLWAGRRAANDCRTGGWPRGCSGGRALMVRVLLALWHVVGLVLAVMLVTEYGVEAWRRLGRRLRDGRARRLRPTPGEESAAPDAVRILCFGGSTMMGMGARDAHTIPAMLARRLGELGHRVAVTNYGQLGHNTTQETITLQRLLKAGERIDIAVFYDGVNEMACAEQTGRADGLFNEANRRAEFNLLHPDRRRDLVAAAAMMVAPRTLRRLRELTGRELRGPLPAPAPDLARIDLEALARAVIETYAQNLRLIRMLGREYGFAPVFFWQPVITTKRVRSPDEQRWARDYTRDPENRTRLYRAIIDERRRRPDLAAAPDAHDLSALFDDWAEPVYIDLYHLSERGNAAVAEAMLPAVAAAVEARVAAGRGL